jgi:hypothetical protein
MAGFLTSKCDEIRRWLAIGSDVYPDSVVTSWIRMAEEYLSTALRVKHMIQIDRSAITQDRTALPHDWQEIRLIRTFPDRGVVRYITPDEFFNPEFKDPPKAPYPYKDRRYTILGNYIIFGGVAPAPFGDEPPTITNVLEVEMTYYQSIPPLTEDNNNWINCMHPIIYTLKILHIAAMYTINDDRAPVWDTEVVRLVNGMNAQHKIDMASGSVLMQVRRKSFG